MGALVWAFEPSRESHRCAQVTVALNALGNVGLFNAGLGDRRRLGTLITSDRDGVALGGASHFADDADSREAQASEEAQIFTIDEIVGAGRRVVAIHLDVERGEQSALDGAMRTIRRCRPLIVVESLPVPTWIAASLSPFGYELSGMTDANFVFSRR